MDRLWKYLRRYTWRYLFGSLCLFATASAVMAIPILTRHAIDAIGADGPAPERIALVAHYALLVVVLAVAQAVVRTISRVLIFNAGRDVEYDLRGELFDHLLRLHQGYYQHQRTGDLMSRLVNDIGAVRMLLGPGILTLLNTPLYLAYAFSIMVWMDPALTLAALLPFPLILILMRRYMRAMMEATVRTQEKLATMSAFAQETLAGIHVVKSFVREEARAAEFRALNDLYQVEAMTVARLRGRIFPAIRAASSLGIVVVLAYGGNEVVKGRLSLGQFVAFMGYLQILAWPLMSLGFMIALVQRGRAALLRLGEIFNIEPAIASPAGDGAEAGGYAPQLVRGEVVFEHVDFGYAGQANGAGILHDVTLRVPAGSSLGILGRTGCGKSTLACLLPRLFDTVGGAVLVDGVDVRRWNLPALRGAIGFVPQDPFLFSTTIERNIGFGRSQLPAGELAGLVETSGLDADLAEFPAGLDTPVGERGVTLSGGQKQRLTLARAIARDPRILVLDDSLSSVDAATESRILEHLGGVMQGRTTIVISHRVSSVRRADRVAVLDEGRVVEEGTHTQLLARGGIYADLYRRQSLTEELEAL
ncbi:MAG: ABC transporter ATP-binding protein [Deltaproteobacteria bacterium]|nr:ABC transporter ATP-binding protein [Deltaproteobacteria bacterium]